MSPEELCVTTGFSTMPNSDPKAHKLGHAEALRQVYQKVKAMPEEERRAIRAEVVRDLEANETA